MIEAVPQPVTIDVISDVVCPWCFIGRRRLLAALDMVERPVDVSWRPYQLDPTIPPGGLSRADYMARKFGPEKIAQIHERLTEVGAQVGIPFAFDKITRSPNTLDAHRLIRWAQASGRQGAVVERLFSLYFVEGQDIGDREVLVQVARDHDLDAEAIARGLASDTDKQAVVDEIATAQRIGVTGVPFFIFANKLAVSGAQGPDVIAAAIEQAAEKVALA